MTNYTLSSLHVKSLNTISCHINLLPCYASHRLKQVCCRALDVIIFCLTIVACDVSVSFLNACDVGFGPVFFCAYEECKPLINLSGSPQGHSRFDVLATPCGVHVAHGHSTHAEAFTLLESYRCNHQGIHCVVIIPSHSSIIRRTHP